MSNVELRGDTVAVHLTRWEKVAGLLRDVEFPRSAVVSAEALPDGIGAAKGLRAPGLAWPGLRKVGTWRRRGSRTLVAVRRGEPALRLRLEGTAWSQVLVSTPDAEALAARLSGTASR